MLAAGCGWNLRRCRRLSEIHATTGGYKTGGEGVPTVLGPKRWQVHVAGARIGSGAGQVVQATQVFLVVEIISACARLLNTRQRGRRRQAVHWRRTNIALLSDDVTKQSVFRGTGLFRNGACLIGPNRKSIGRNNQIGVAPVLAPRVGCTNKFPTSFANFPSSSLHVALHHRSPLFRSAIHISSNHNSSDAMRASLILGALLSTAISTYGQAVEEGIAPDSPPPPGCEETVDGNFTIGIAVQVGKKMKRETAQEVRALLPHLRYVC